MRAPSRRARGQGFGQALSAAWVAWSVASCGGGGAASQPDAASDGAAAPNADATATPNDATAMLNDAASDGGGADTSTGGLPDASEEGGACNLDLTHDGTCNSIPLAAGGIASTCSSGAAPTPQGGAIEDGTYVLDSMTYYGTCPSAPVHQSTTWIVCGQSWQSVQQFDRVTGDPDAGTQIERIGVTAQLQSSSITATVDCWYTDAAAPTQVTWTYDAAPGHLVLYIAENPGVRADSFTRQ